MIDIMCYLIAAVLLWFAPDLGLWEWKPDISPTGRLIGRVCLVVTGLFVLYMWHGL